MADRKTWNGLVLSYRGKLMLWVDQSTDSKLLSANSRGVCFALTRDWVEYFISSRTGRYEFISLFDWEEDASSRIPAIYIQKQAEHKSLFEAELATFTSIMNEAFKDRDPGEEEAAREWVEAHDAFAKQFYGPKCTDYIDLGEMNGRDEVQDIFDLVMLNDDPAYYMLSMKNKTTRRGHSVGFEIRPDLNFSSRISKVYEFFDPNLGLFLFTNYDYLRRFFLSAVLTFYQDDGYNYFEVATFKV